MKPLATPVIGGMISSLIHILIVTPVIFLWLRGREFKNGTLVQSLTNESKPQPSHRKA
jgi:Cu(I)/Ag(I) efflux system membrane protein CusA/SilA